MRNSKLSILDGALRGFRMPTVVPPDPVEGQLCIAGGMLQKWSSGEWAAVSYVQTPYDFAGHMFTSAGKIGRAGPSLLQVRSAYSSVAWAQDQRWLNVVDGIQLWYVPLTGVYEFDVLGAVSQNPVSGSIDPRSMGRVRIRCRIALEAGDILHILVGQPGNPIWTQGGGTYAACSMSSSPGGTFIESAKRGLLLVAGGEGLNVSSPQTSLVVTTEQAGKYRIQSVEYNSAAVVGQGGKQNTLTTSSIAYSYGGGGYLTDGEGAGGGKSFKNGGLGGTHTAVTFNGSTGSVTVEGGFGGGACSAVATPASQPQAVSGIGGAGGYTGGTGGLGQYGVGVPLGGTGGSFTASFATNVAKTIVSDPPAMRNGQVRITMVEE